MSGKAKCPNCGKRALGYAPPEIAAKYRSDIAQCKGCGKRFRVRGGGTGQSSRW